MKLIDTRECPRHQQKKGSEKKSDTHMASKFLFGKVEYGSKIYSRHQVEVIVGFV